MIRNTPKKRALFASAVVAAGAMVLSIMPAQAASQPGITKTEIKLGITSPLSGRVAAVYGKIPGAMKAYFSHVNDNGGVYGRKINLVSKDDAYVPTLAVKATNDLIMKDKVFAIVGALGTANHLAALRSANLSGRGIPDLFVNTGFSGFANKSRYKTTFAVLPSYVMEAKIMAKYIDDNFKGKKVALIVQDDDFGVDALAGFAAAGLKPEVTIKFAAGADTLAAAQGWITSQLKPAAVDIAIIFATTTTSAAVLGAAAGLQYRPTSGWMLGSVGGDSNTLRAGGVPLAILNGALGASFAPDPADATDEYVNFFKSIYAKYVPGSTFDLTVLQGMNTAMLTVQALRAAGKNPTRAGLIKAIETKGSKFASAGYTGLKYSSTSRVGYDSYWIGKYTATGSLQPIDGKRVLYTTDSSSGAVKTATVSRAPLPTNGLPTNS
jgi:branched-chain amino acid transport system substrate-binding protein